MPANKVMKTDEEWKVDLSEEEYRVLRKKGAEAAFTGKLYDSKATGVFVCAGCGQELFQTDTKFDSSTGWPSFYAPISGDCIAAEADNSVGMIRTEVLCSRCDGHLGHVFEDGPAPTGLRYCINSVSINLVEKD